MRGDKACRAILLPGIRLNDDGSAPEEMALRVDRAFKAWKNGAAPLIIACGGDAAGAGESEAHRMKSMLTALGVPEDCVLAEDTSLVTAENFQNAARLIGKGAPCALVTSDYHMPRAKLLAKRSGFRVLKTFKARTPAGIYKAKRRLLEFLGVLDALCGWQDEGRRRPRAVEKFKEFMRRSLLKR